MILEALKGTTTSLHLNLIEGDKRKLQHRYFELQTRLITEENGPIPFVKRI